MHSYGYPPGFGGPAVVFHYTQQAEAARFLAVLGRLTARLRLIPSRGFRLQPVQVAGSFHLQDLDEECRDTQLLLPQLLHLLTDFGMDRTSVALT